MNSKNKKIMKTVSEIIIALIIGFLLTKANLDTTFSLLIVSISATCLYIVETFKEK